MGRFLLYSKTLVSKLWDRLYQVWMLIIAFIIYCIPIIGIYIELSKENVLHRILGTVACYLTKEV